MANIANIALGYTGIITILGIGFGAVMRGVKGAIFCGAYCGITGGVITWLLS